MASRRSASMAQRPPGGGEAEVEHALAVIRRLGFSFGYLQHVVIAELWRIVCSASSDSPSKVLKSCPTKFGFLRNRFRSQALCVRPTGPPGGVTQGSGEAHAVGHAREVRGSFLVRVMSRAFQVSRFLYV